MDGNVSCKVCTHYHHQGNQHLCDAGIYEVQIAGKADVVITQQDCSMAHYKLTTELIGSNEVITLDKRTKAYKDSVKC